MFGTFTKPFNYGELPKNFDLLSPAFQGQ